MLKKELEIALKESQNRVELLENIIIDYTDRAVDELSPCDNGLDLIDEVREKAGLPERTTDVVVEMIITAPARIADEMYDADMSRFKLLFDGNLYELSELTTVIEEG